MPACSSASLISVWSYSSDPSKVVIRTRSRSSIRNTTRLAGTPFGYGASMISIVRSFRKPVFHNDRKSSSSARSIVSSNGVHRSCDGRLIISSICM